MNARFYANQLWISVSPLYEAVDVETLFGLLEQDSHLTETSHSYIQWLFPIDTPSKFNMNSRCLQREEASAIARCLLPSLRLRKSLVTMLSFYGFSLAENCIVCTDRRRMLQITAHNHLRITRILRCLVLMGCSVYALAFFKALGSLASAGHISNLTYNFWESAATLPAPPDYPKTNCLHTFDKLPRKKRIHLLCHILRHTTCHAAIDALTYAHGYNDGEVAVIGCLTPKNVAIRIPARIVLVVLVFGTKRCRRVRMQDILGITSGITTWRISTIPLGMRGLFLYKLIRTSPAYSTVHASNLCQLQLSGEFKS